MKLLAAGLLLLVSSVTFADQLENTKTAYRSALTTMASIYRGQYAPAEWKRNFSGWDLEAALQQGINSIDQATTFGQRDGRAVLKQFIGAMKDYHVSIRFLSTETASLPLTIRGTQGHYYIVNIDRSKLSYDVFPYFEGDEVVGFDGRPTAEVIAELQTELKEENVAMTDHSLAQLALTRRSAANGLHVPRGPIDLAIRHRGQSDFTAVQVAWEYTPEQITPAPGIGPRAQTGDATATGGVLTSPDMSVDLGWASSDLEPSSAENTHLIGARRSFVPELGTKIWESSPRAIFHAATYMTDDRRMIGFIRIPGYIVQDYDAAVAEFASLITQFERSTDGLVIDQINNGGGSVFYLYTLASMLAPQGLRTPQHLMTTLPSDLPGLFDLEARLQAVKTDQDARRVFGASFAGYPVSYQFTTLVKEYIRTVLEDYRAGQRLTRPSFIYGVDRINPATTTYSKPILLLVNELDFSGGDFFPAILQDNHRAVIMGTRTAGAGGYVLRQQFTNMLGLDSFTVTGSIAKRVNDSPIENLGVTPDIGYSFTAADFENGFSDYRAAILGTINTMVKH